jgi:hypothetical protein
MSLAGGWIADAPDFLLGRNVNAITSLAGLPRGVRGGFGFNAAGDTPSVAHAAVVLAVYSVAFVALAFHLFRKRDLTG